MERLLNEGRVRAIWVCNFKEPHLKELIDKTSVKPVVNQVELHPYFNQRELNKVNTALGIITQAWSPVGGAMIYHPEERSLPHILKHETITSIAQQHSKSPAQVVLRWHLQQGRSVIPKSVHQNRIIENFDVFDYSLTKDELKSIDDLDVGMRIGPDPDEYDIHYTQKEN